MYCINYISLQVEKIQMVLQIQTSTKQENT